MKRVKRRQSGARTRGSGLGSRVRLAFTSRRQVSAAKDEYGTDEELEKQGGEEVLEAEQFEHVDALLRQDWCIARRAGVESA